MRTAITAVLIGTVLMAGAAGAQTHGGGMQHGAGGAAGAPGHPQGHAEAQRCDARFEEVVGQGLGFGLAFAADRNGYPGPTHVLELRDRLTLSAEQHAQVQALLESMFAQSRPASAALLEAEARLRALFETNRATEERLRVQVAETERLRARLRLVHLSFHLRTRDLLTEAQRAVYHAARWGAR